jgi:ubiquinone/menaquinone biosynthesis C-methylase UbiE
MKFTDPTYLKTDQYRDASNLNARIAIHERFSTNLQGWWPWFWDVAAQLPAEADVLELGCGSWAMWMACPERIPPGWRVTVSDFSAGMLDSAWRKLVTLGRGFKFEQIDAQQIPYPDETFDIVIANFMLYHVPDRPRALTEVLRILRPGGTLVAATGGENHLREIKDWFEHLDLALEIAVFRNPFTIENGLEQLQPFFTDIKTMRYGDSLRVTELLPLMAYLKSTATYSDNPESAFAKLEHQLADELQTKGAIHITKDTGLFLARKG